jgi:hypothetical protein
MGGSGTETRGGRAEEREVEWAQRSEEIRGGGRAPMPLDFSAYCPLAPHFYDRNVNLQSVYSIAVYYLQSTIYSIRVYYLQSTIYNIQYLIAIYNLHCNLQSISQTTYLPSVTTIICTLAVIMHHCENIPLSLRKYMPLSLLDCALFGTPTVGVYTSGASSSIFSYKRYGGTASHCGVDEPRKIDLCTG